MLRTLSLAVLLCVLVSSAYAEKTSWQNAASLKKNAKLKTGAKNSLQWPLDASFYAGIKLMPDSRAVVLSENPLRLMLEQGELLFLCENEIQPPINNSFKRAAGSDTISILTAHAEITLRSGGFSAKTSKEGTLLRVYSESVGWTARPSKKDAVVKKGDEGFRYWIKDSSVPVETKRMHYNDYLIWQEWMKHFMEMRDDVMRQI